MLFESETVNQDNHEILVFFYIGVSLGDKHPICGLRSRAGYGGTRRMPLLHPVEK